ncbi:hypothetical protein OSB04_005656 [Centaurea solstitialis]|uniref:Uncharacterized protein n=1 Tax=Centaurea solstitialis TaxID=347529 RepID=A0AA38WS85_9ASTR|nr:hypothetical protein OSB04_005656 [Centaurea solstitialis]
MSLLRFLKKNGESSSSGANDSGTTKRVEKTIGEDNEKEQHKYTKVDLNSLPVDPAERPSIDFYHVNQRDEIRRAYLQKGPCQPQNHIFPQRDFDDNKYWLEYSIKEDAAFCLCCYLFKSNIPNQGGSDNFVKSGFKAWNRKARLDLHKAGNPHNIDVQKCQILMNQRQSIASAFEKQTTSQEHEYRIRLNASIDCVRFLLRQGLAFRGHSENEDSHNKGNFLELLQWLADRCDVVDRVVLKNAPRNAQMKCGDIQKDIVQACSETIINVIMEDLGNDLFAILVDESRDVSCKEQMALVLRFINKKGEVVERFIGLRNVSDTSALSLKATIYDMLSKWKLSPTRIRGQGYDGASNMSGAFNGLKTLIMNETKSAYFIHCFAHQLQLALVFVAKNHTKINDFFDVVSRLLNIIGSSYKRRDNLRRKQATKVVAALAEGELESGTGLNQEVGIKRPCDTRWGSHFASLLNIQTIYPSICEVLEDLGDDNNDSDRKAEALRILKSLKSFDFVFCLHLMVDILGVTDHLNTTLQRKDQDIVNAMNQNDAQILDLNDAYYNGISRRRGSQVSNLHHYQVDVFYAVIDMQLPELNHRFNEVNTTLLLCIACLCPSESFKAFDLDKLLKMATFYPEEFPTEHDLRVLEFELQNYIKDVREDERFNQLKSIGDLGKKMVETKKHIIFPKVYLLLKLALILPVATSSVEHAFSAMKLIKTSTRNKMGDQFLSDYLVSYIEKKWPCVGHGCCHNPIPDGMTSAVISVLASKNHSRVWDYNTCGYGFIVEKHMYTFNTGDLSTMSKNMSFPVVLDWSVGYTKCKEAQMDNATYVCKENSVCYDGKGSLSGYRCKCSDGFTGNPYLEDGCKGLKPSESSRKFLPLAVGTIVIKCKTPRSKIFLEEALLRKNTSMVICIQTTTTKTTPPPPPPPPPWTDGGGGGGGSEGFLADAKRGGECIPLPKSEDRAVIAGIGEGVAGAAVAMIFVYWGAQRRLRIKDRKDYFKKNGGTMLQEMWFTCEDPVRKGKIFTEEELKKATDNFNNDKVIGQGGYGIVYIGTLANKTMVAIKKSKMIGQSQIQQFVNEVIILSQINHPNIVKLLGCCLETHVPLLVYEYITNNTLCHHIHSHSTLTLGKRLKIAAETAEALDYMHSMTQIIHRDVKPSNILLDNEFTAKISDFGISRFVPLGQTHLSTSVKGTVGYMDPEYFRTSKLTDKSDVFSFGVVLMELLMGKEVRSLEIPLTSYKGAAAYLSSLLTGDAFVLVLDDQIKKDEYFEVVKCVAKIAINCLDLEGMTRPTMKEVKQELEQLRCILLAIEAESI